jgi:hypothetical protein
MSSPHSWKFFRAGGVDQVVLSTGADLRNLASLDQKLWAALACPAKGLEFDERTLTLLDSDGNGRIRPPEVLAAIAWVDGALRNLDELFTPSEELPLDSIANDSPIGKELHAGAKLILESLGKKDAKAISLADVSSTETIFLETKLNGDGIIPADSADDEATRRAIEDVIAMLGAVPDRSTKPGVDQAKVDAFFTQIALHAEWVAAGGTSPRVLGDATAAAGDALEAVRSKVDDYFARCRLAAFDAHAVLALNPTEADLAALGPQTLTSDTEGTAKLPLARVEAGLPLPLGDGVNPAWAARIDAFAKATVTPVMGSGRTSLTESDWTALKDRLAPYSAWKGTEPATVVAKLGDARVTELAQSDARARITELIAKDAALATQVNQIESVEKLIRFRRHLVPFLRNFVNFAEFYGKRTSMFQAGTLYIDARSCDLTLAVEDAGRHALLAGKSEAFLIYCDCVRKSDAAKRTIVSAVTDGDTDNILVGRNGIFYDRAGGDWDATITKLVEAPISIRQAFWLPYKRFVRLVEDQFAKRAKAADDESNKKLDSMAAATATVGAATDDKEKDKKEDAPPKGIDIGTVAAIGVAVGGIATFFSSILATFLGLGMWMPVGVLALVFGISGPSMLRA